MQSTPLVSIIVVNWNGGSVLLECLSSLSKINYPNWELIFVDNGSSDGSEREVARLFKKAKIIKNTNNIGFAPANNQAMKLARGQYLLLLNNDTKVTTNFLDFLVKRALLDEQIAVVQPKILMMDKQNHLDNAGGFLTKIGFLEHRGFGEKDGKQFSQETEIFTAKGACMLIRKEAILKTGLFDPDFFSYFEETDFCWRAWLAGYKVLYYPKAKIYHKVGFTIKRLDVGNINYHYYKNRISSLIKNLQTKNLVVVLPSHLFISVGIATVFLLRGQWKSSFMIFRAIIWNLIYISKTLSKRSKIQKVRVIKDIEIFEKFLKPINWQKFWGDFRRVEQDIKNQPSQR